MDKTPDDSKAEVIIRMFPSDANPAGNVFGGAILKHIDMVAGIWYSYSTQHILD